MLRVEVIVMINLLTVMGLASLAAGQSGGDEPGDAGARGWNIDKQSNGQPSPAQIDADAVAQLEQAEAMAQEEGREREAVTLALSLLPTFESGQDYDHLVDCVFLIGDLYYNLGDWENALRYAKRAADLGYRYFPDDMSSYPLKIIGESQFELGDHEAALATFQERVQKLRRTGDTADLAGALFDVGGLYINLGREPEALPVLTEALEVNKKRGADLARPDSAAGADERAGNAVDHAEIAYHLAIAYFRLEDFAEADKYLQEALAGFLRVQQAGQAEVEDRLVAVLDDLVVVSEKLGNAAEAEQYRQQRDTYNQ